MKYITGNTQETKTLARDFSQTITLGGVYGFSGDLGSGKTTFIQGALDALGAEGPYTSPTFNLVKIYDLDKVSAGGELGLERVYHIDAYRLESDQLDNIGWEDIVSDQKAVVFVEWPEMLGAAFPVEAKKLMFVWVDENQREIIIEE